jgi:glycosyltransferase involved in cell wall biosynthesis
MTTAAAHTAPISVVIATRNRADRLHEALAPLTTATCRPAEVIVVDSASDTDDAAQVAATFGARYLRVDVPGVCRARNAGWRAASNDAVAFLDDDVHVHPEWAAQISAALSDNDADFVTGWIGLPPGQQDAQDPQPLMIEPLPRRLDHTTREHMGASANMAARQAALAKVGGFDERLGPGTWFAASEDEDLFDRLVLAGLVGSYCPTARVDHDAWRGRRDRLRQHWCYGKGTGARLRLLSRRDRVRARQEAVERLWRRGVVQLSGRLRRRWLMGAACSFLRLTGAAVGFLVALAALRDPWPVG